MTEEISNAIRQSPLFEHLSEDVLQRVATDATLYEIEDGQPLIEEGKKVGNLFLLVSGSVRVFTNALGRTVDLTVLNAGSYVGEVSLLSGKLATATVEAKGGPVKVVAITRDEIVELVNSDETLRKTLEGITLARAKDTLGKVLG